MKLAHKARELNNALKEHRKLEKELERLAQALDLATGQNLEEEYHAQMSELMARHNALVDKIQDISAECEQLIADGGLEKG
jgi:phage host-nuclease inhibitor protein Gam